MLPTISVDPAFEPGDPDKSMPGTLRPRRRKLGLFSAFGVFSRHNLRIVPRRAERGAYTDGFGDDNGVDDPKQRRYERADRKGLWKI